MKIGKMYIDANQMEQKHFANLIIPNGCAFFSVFYTLIFINVKNVRLKFPFIRNVLKLLVFNLPFK